MAGKGQSYIRISWDGDRAINAMRQGTYTGSLETARKVLNDSRATAERRTGTLIRSSAITVNELPNMKSVFEASGGGKSFTGIDHADVFLPQRTPTSREVRIYISYNTPYAGKIHETQSQFLMAAITRSREEFFSNIGSEVRKALKLTNRIKFGR